MSQSAALMDEASELPSWGVKQKPMISLPPLTASVGVEMTAWERMRP